MSLLASVSVNRLCQRTYIIENIFKGITAWQRLIKVVLDTVMLRVELVTSLTNPSFILQQYRVHSPKNQVRLILLYIKIASCVKIKSYFKLKCLIKWDISIENMILIFNLYMKWNKTLLNLKKWKEHFKYLMNILDNILN